MKGVGGHGSGENRSQGMNFNGMQRGPQGSPPADRPRVPRTPGKEQKLDETENFRNHGRSPMSVNISHTHHGQMDLIIDYGRREPVPGSRGHIPQARSLGDFKSQLPGFTFWWLRFGSWNLPGKCKYENWSDGRPRRSGTLVHPYPGNLVDMYCLSIIAPDTLDDHHEELLPVVEIV